MQLVRITVSAVLAGVLALATALPTHAQTTIQLAGAGPRLGLSASPDQLVLGGQASLTVAPEWTFDPSVELGFGDGETDFGVNFDGFYHARLTGSDWRPYFGGGLAINTASIDEPPPLHDISDTHLGINLVLGATVPSAAGHLWFGELRFGVGDVPNLKLIAGINFKL